MCHMVVFSMLSRFAFLTLLLAGGILSSAAAQDCLSIRVVDPSGVTVATTAVTIGADEQLTDDAGAAYFCGVGDGPHSVTVTVPTCELRRKPLTAAWDRSRLRSASRP